MKRIVAMVLLCLPWLLIGVPAQAQGAQAQGWWSAVHRAALPAPPTPPDVAADDLLLQGGDPARLLPAGAVDQTPSPSAYAALRFATPAGSTVGSLTLTVASGAQAADVRAYPAKGGWVPAQGGAIEDAPAPDLTRFSVGVLTGTTLVFRDVGRLVADDGTLSIVLLPGAADRLVVHPPLPTALMVTGLPAAPALSPVPRPVDPPAPQPAPVSAPVTPAFLRPVAPPVLLQPAPVAAPQPVDVAPAALRPRVLTLVADDRRTRWFVGLEAALALAYFGLLARTRAAASSIRGVGRFASDRAGAPPRL